ncbi:hypothetical protein BROUX41_000252 [Berkeleyomyces rouxiae]|uniref:uncharacterized protein n=1 Tax=Berkeleyomyces rouxiae TaxID=2035830 RepID=UPI003B764CDA
MTLILESALAAALSCGLAIIIISVALYKHSTYCQRQQRQRPPALPFHLGFKHHSGQKDIFLPVHSPASTHFHHTEPSVSFAEPDAGHTGLFRSPAFAKPPSCGPILGQDSFEAAWAASFGSGPFNTTLSSTDAATHFVEPLDDIAPDDLTPLSSRAPSACYSQRPRAIYWEDSFYSCHHDVTGDDEPAVLTALSPAVTRRPSQTDSIEDDEPFLVRPASHALMPENLSAALAVL